MNPVKLRHQPRHRIKRSLHIGSLAADARQFHAAIFRKHQKPRPRRNRLLNPARDLRLIGGKSFNSSRGYCAAAILIFLVIIIHMEIVQYAVEHRHQHKCPP